MRPIYLTISDIIHSMYMEEWDKLKDTLFTEYFKLTGKHVMALLYRGQVYYNTLFGEKSGVEGIQPNQPILLDLVSQMQSITNIIRKERRLLQYMCADVINACHKREEFLHFIPAVVLDELEIEFTDDHIRLDDLNKLLTKHDEAIRTINMNLARKLLQ